MKILICEDNDRKYEHIENVVLKTIPNAEILRVVFAKAAVVKLKNENFDILIQDMQLPINSDDRIDIKGGMYVLNQIEHRNIDVKYCVCSSDSNSYKFMIEYGFETTPFIDYSSSMFQSDLSNFLKGI